MLNIKNLFVTYDNKTDVLKNINLHIEKGEWVAIIGRSGSGKSTLLRSINLLVRPRLGEILFNNVNIIKLNKKELRNTRRKIAFIFQDYNLIDNLNVLENVLTSRLAYQSFFASLIGYFTKNDYERASKSIRRVGLEEKIFEKARNLSGGQQQRVAIAKALCQDAELILADEPVSSLDLATTEQIMEYFKLIHEIKGKTILINLHQIEIAKKYCSRIIGISDGEIIFDGKVGELTDDIIQKLYDK